MYHSVLHNPLYPGNITQTYYDDDPPSLKTSFEKMWLCDSSSVSWHISPQGKLYAWSLKWKMSTNILQCLSSNTRIWLIKKPNEVQFMHCSLVNLLCWISNTGNAISFLMHISTRYGVRMITEVENCTYTTALITDHILMKSIKEILILRITYLY